MAVKISELATTSSVTGDETVPVVQNGVTKGVSLGDIVPIRRTAAETSAGVTPSAFQYPVGHMFRYGVPTDGTSDCTPALNKAIAVAAQVTSGVRFYFPAIGTVYRFTTQPDDIEGAMQIYGDGRQTVLYRDYNGSTAEDGLFNFRGEGEYPVVRDMSILGVSGRSGGCLISVVADATNNVSWGLLDNLRLTTTGTDTHDYDLYVDGSVNDDDPVGVRLMTARNCEMFGAALGSAFIKSTMAFQMLGCRTFDAGGTTGKIVLRGTATVPAYYTYISGGFNAGIDASDCEQLLVTVSRISGNITLASSVEDPLILGHCTGTVTDNATYTNRSVATLLNTRNILADKVLIGNLTSSSFALEAVGAITGRTSGSVTNVGHIGGTFTTVCPDEQSFTITTTNTLKDLRIATAGGAGAQFRGDFKTAALDMLDPSGEYENSATPTGTTGVSKSANSHVITVVNDTGSQQTYTILSVGNISSVTDPA